MSLTPGTRLGPYEILAKLGEGGMGEVYRAKDTRLARSVAIKVLPPGTATDASARARFEREARAVAALSHPHICTIHDVGHQDGTDYLVMELLDGETLADRLAKTKGALPLDQVFTIGVAIADALDKAHRAGIVHRDLKPANVMLTRSGPKLLDFGLAKEHAGTGDSGGAGWTVGGRAAAPNQPDSPDPSSASTLVTPARLTSVGTILGTLHYMAPEQVEGREADSRTDIWALGALLYEMATGTRPFDGASPASVLGSILKDTPLPLSAGQPLTPPAFEHLVNRCLEKDPDDRWQSVRDVKRELAWIASGLPPLGVVATPLTRPRSAVAVSVALAVTTAASLALAWPATRHLREAAGPPAQELRLDVATPPTNEPSVMALSPDGRSIIFRASDAGVAKLWLRSLDRADAKPIPGTENGSWPFWSPDGQSIGFFAGAKLQRLDLAGGPPRALADAPSPAGGTWGPDGTVLFTPAVATRIMRVPASGGAVEPVTELSSGHTSHYAPWLLPDGRTFLFSVQGTPAVQGLYLATLGGGTPRRLNDIFRGTAAFIAPNYLIFSDGVTLAKQKLDVATATTTGKPEAVGPMVWGAGPTSSGGGGGTGFSVSGNGLVAYRSESLRKRTLMWRDRTGRELGRAGGAGGDTLLYINLSPDDRMVAGARLWPGDPDLWVRDLARDSETRMTFTPGSDTIPAWAPDGQRIAFISNRSGNYGIYLGSLMQPGAETPLLVTSHGTVVQDWSPDGRFILFYETNPKTGRDLWSLDLNSSDHTTHMVSVTPAEESLGKFSPDGRWVAYQTNASGRFEIVVKAFRAGSVEGGTWQVSKDGGVQPRWSRDGKELYFIAPDGGLYASTITAGSDTLDVRPPEKLFNTRINGGGGIGSNASEYAVARDGRFLFNEVVEDNAVPITMVLNSTF